MGDSACVEGALNHIHARIQKVLSEGSKFDDVFLLMSGGRIKIPLLAGHHRPASEKPLKWRFSGVPMMALH